MRKPVYAICEPQRRRSACTSAQSDLHLCFRCLDNMITKVAVCMKARLMSASVAEQTSLSLTWSEIPKNRFSHDVVQMMMGV